MSVGKVKKNPFAGKSGAEREFVKLVDELTRIGLRHSEVFDDFLELAFCALAKGTHFPTSKTALSLEERYMRRVNARDKEYIRKMPRLLALSQIALARGGCDFLGAVSGELGALNGQAGQYFTPFEVCKLMATLTMPDRSKPLNKEGYIAIHEPACGAGAMIIAATDVLVGNGIDLGDIIFEATDISHAAYKMAYIQLSLRGVPARVFNGNTLTNEVWDFQFTPATERFLVKHSDYFTRQEEKKDGAPVDTPFFLPPAINTEQLDLF